jgi:hypothetical protein
MIHRVASPAGASRAGAGATAGAKIGRHGGREGPDALPRRRRIQPANLAAAIE